MIKRITAGLATIALAAGLGLAALPANAQSAMQNALCAAGDDGASTVDCGIETNTPTITEGDSVAVTVRGALDVTVGVALFANTGSGLERISGPVEVTVHDEVDGTSVSLPVPVLDGTHRGGSGYVVALADATDTPDPAFVRDLTIFSAHPSINGQPWGEGTEESPLSVPIVGGIPGDQFKLQASVDGTWVDFATVGGDVVNQGGSTHLSVTYPDATLGDHPVRLYNVSRDVASPADLTLTFGVEPEPEPTPTEEPTDEPTAEPTDEPTTEPTDEPTQAPTPVPTATSSATAAPVGGGLGAGGRPGLPSTGVLA